MKDDLAGFQTFDRRMGRISHPTLTITKRGNISFNGASYEALGKPDLVELLFNVDTNSVAIRSANDNPNAYKLRSQGTRSKFYTCSGIAFVKHYGIDITVGRRYMPVVSNGLLIADLSSGGVEVTSNRKANQEKLSHNDPNAEMNEARLMSSGESSPIHHEFITAEPIEVDNDPYTAPKNETGDGS